LGFENGSPEKKKEIFADLGSNLTPQFRKVLGSHRLAQGCPDPQDSAMSWKKQSSGRQISLLRIDRRWNAWARAIVSRHDYSRALGREKAPVKEGN
jgi:hypothetical protein